MSLISSREAERWGVPGMLGQSRLFARILEDIRKVQQAATRAVLITGESGTGKGVTARSIHEQSQRAEFPFIPVNCSAIPENLKESEFFGHAKGAFTGADKAHKGLFTQADRGTIFLDEIGELPLHLQTKLLHVIEDKQIRPLGSEQTRSVDVRIIAATNRNLEAMCKENKFREDFHLHRHVILSILFPVEVNLVFTAHTLYV